MPPVSVIHAPRDEALGEKIASALANAGHAATRVISDPDKGDLETAEREDGPAIVVWTEAAAKLARLRDQAMAAMARGALVPVAVGGARPPGGFENLPPVDLSGWTGAADDPRWRFVLEEVHLASRRTLLRDGEVWAEPQNDAAPAAETPAPDEEGAETAAPPPFLAQSRRRSSSARRRFSAKEVAIGATAGLLLMTAATAVLAPVVLPGSVDAPLAQPSIAAPAEDAIPDPSLDRPSTLAALTTGDPENDQLTDIIIPPAPLGGDDSSQSPEAVGGAEPDDIPMGAAEVMTASLEAGAETEAEFSGASSAAEVADSDAMENLIAAVTAESGAATPSLEAIDPLPADVIDSAYLGNYFKECVECPDMAALPAGSFRMGARPGETTRDAAERPVVDVTIAKRFAIGTREVTYAQWDACVADGGCAHAPSDHGWGRGKQPVVSVSYEDAVAYTQWLSQKTGQPYRLPTEAEWEYAARAGAEGPFAFGGDLNIRQANFNGQFPYRGEKEIFRQGTTPAASFPPNAFGLFDMHGNAWEWTSDCWNASHAGAPADGSARDGGDCARAVLKGGAWNTGAWRLRAAHRIGKSKTAREFDNGFRVARDLN